MDLNAIAYEVWIESIKGVRSKAATPEGASSFKKLEDAHRFAETFLNDGMVVRAVVVETRPIESINCGGVHAARMGLNRINITGGGKIKVGKDLSPFRKPES